MKTSIGYPGIRIAVAFLPALLGIDRTGINTEMYKEESL